MPIQFCDEWDDSRNTNSTFALQVNRQNRDSVAVVSEIPENKGAPISELRVIIACRMEHMFQKPLHEIHVYEQDTRNGTVCKWEVSSFQESKKEFVQIKLKSVSPEDVEQHIGESITPPPLWVSRIEEQWTSKIYDAVKTYRAPAGGSEVHCNIRLFQQEGERPVAIVTQYPQSKESQAITIRDLAVTDAILKELESATGVSPHRLRYIECWPKGTHEHNGQMNRYPFYEQRMVFQDRGQYGVLPETPRAFLSRTDVKALVGLHEVDDPYMRTQNAQKQTAATQARSDLKENRLPDQNTKEPWQDARMANGKDHSIDR